MNINLVFDNSGDVLEFCSINSQIVEYYIDFLNSNNTNSFSNNQKARTITEAINNLHSATLKVNRVIGKFTGTLIPTYDYLEYLDQSILNKLHADWVNLYSIKYNIDILRSSKNKEIVDIGEQLHYMFPDDIRNIPLGTLLDKLKLSNLYSSVNECIHILETRFNKVKFTTTQWLEVKNIFSKDILTNNICNLTIAFNHLGRTLYNKFETFDNNLQANDENSYDQLLGFIEVKIVKPQTIPLSREYIAWCKKLNKVPSGNFLNIGNLVDTDTKLTKYRQVMYNNLKYNNSCSLHLNKG